MDYNKFNFKAVVDYIEIQIQTAQPTAYDALRRHTGLPFFDPINPTSRGNSATIFTVKIHDPQRWADVVSAVNNIAAKGHELVGQFEVVGVEVALDAIPISGTASMLELATMAAHLAKHSTFSHDNVRLYREGCKKGDFPFRPTNDRTTVRYMAMGWQHMRGDKGSDCCQHAYAKVTDHNKKPLPIDQHRARIEITLRGDELPCSTLEEWKNHRFEKLAKPYFTYRKRKTVDNIVSEDGCMNVAKLRESMYQQQPNFGKRKTQRATPRERLTSKHSVTDNELRDLARHALQELSERWERKKVRDLQSVTACNETKQVHISNNYTVEQSNNYTVEQDQQQEASKTGIDSLDSSPLRGFHQSSLCTDLPLEVSLDAISFADLHQYPEFEEKLKAIDDHYDAKAKRIDEAYREEMKKIADDNRNQAEKKTEV